MRDIGLWSAVTTVVAAILIFVARARLGSVNIDGSGPLVLALLGMNIRNSVGSLSPWFGYLMIAFVLVVLVTAVLQSRFFLATASGAGLIWSLCVALHAPEWPTLFAAGLYVGLTSFVMLQRGLFIFTSPKTSS